MGYLDNNGLAYLWGKIKSYVNGRTTDYIVEEGTSGNWSYTKWNNGRIELINKSYSFSNLSWTAWGGLYYSKPTVPVPSGLLNSTDYIANVFCNQGNFFMVCSVYTKAKTSFIPALARPNNTTTSSSATIQIIGTWK